MIKFIINMELQKIIIKYQNKNLNSPIIVEGINDIKSLKKIHFPGKIININRGKSLYNFSEYISNNYNNVILLTDFDKKGIFLKNKIKVYLNSMDINVDLKLWDYIKNNCHINDVESMPALLDNNTI